MDYAAIYPVIAMMAHGQIGKWWIHKQYKHFRVTTKYYYPTNPQTGVQQGQRALLRDAVTNWQGFDIPTKQHYNSMKRPIQMSGYNRYIRMYLNATEPPTLQYILQESGETDRILQEDGSGILLE